MIRIITDSAADFEPQELQQRNITCIPLVVTIDAQEYRENVNLSKVQFYELMAKAQELPKTAQASPQILIDLFEEAKEKQEDAIYITISSGISGTYSNALIAKDMVDSDYCHVFDSLNGTGGQRMIVEEAVRLRDEGKTAAEIVAGLEAIRGRIVLYACMDTLENLYKGGRISHTVYSLGNMAQIKPIISVDKKGGIPVPAKVMGAKRGVDWLCKQSQKLPMDENYPFYVMYTSDPAKADALAQRLRALGIPVHPEYKQVGAAIGTHVGPDAIGFVYVAKEDAAG